MSLFARRSDGVLHASLGNLAVAYDLVTETRHLLNPAASALLEVCDGATERAPVLEDWATHNDLDLDTLAGQVDGALMSFADLGLIGRSTPWVRPAQRTAAPASGESGAHLGRTHSVADLTIRLRGSDPDLVSQLDTYLGTNVPDAEAEQQSGREPLVFDVAELPDQGYRLIADKVIDCRDLSGLHQQLVALTNSYAVDTDGCLALHAGGVRSPSGSIVLLPASSGSGKSTMTAALVASGWDYLGDEVIGVDSDRQVLGYPKRISLGGRSRTVVGLHDVEEINVDPSDLHMDVALLSRRVGAIDRIVLPSFQPGAGAQIEPLDVLDAFDALLGNTLNLARIGQSGLDTLCQLAETTPVHRLVHGDAVGAVETLIELLDRRHAHTPAAAGGREYPDHADA